MAHALAATIADGEVQQPAGHTRAELVGRFAKHGPAPWHTCAPAATIADREAQEPAGHTRSDLWADS